VSALTRRDDDISEIEQRQALPARWDRSAPLDRRRSSARVNQHADGSCCYAAASIPAVPAARAAAHPHDIANLPKLIATGTPNMHVPSVAPNINKPASTKSLLSSDIAASRRTL
jgi:hypothetical protein